MDIPYDVLRKPKVVLRLMEWLFALIIFACIIDKCKPGAYCVFNDSHACNYGIWLGVFAWLISMVLLAAELFRDALGPMRRTFAVFELFLDAALAFFWFIAFCYLLDQWRKDPGPPAFLEYSQWPSRVVNNAQSAIVFSLFSLLAWAFSAYIDYAEENDGGYRPPGGHTSSSSAYSPFGGGGGYQSGATA